MKDSISSKDFKNTFQHSKVFRSNGILFYYSNLHLSWLGFMVSRGYGNSCERNLFKRRVRFIYRNNQKKNLPTTIVKPTRSNYSYQELKESFNTYFNELNV